MPSLLHQLHVTCENAAACMPASCPMRKVVDSWAAPGTVILALGLVPGTARTQSQATAAASGAEQKTPREPPGVVSDASAAIKVGMRIGAAVPTLPGWQVGAAAGHLCCMAALRCLSWPHALPIFLAKQDLAVKAGCKVAVVTGEAVVSVLGVSQPMLSVTGAALAQARSLLDRTAVDWLSADEATLRAAGEEHRAAFTATDTYVKGQGVGTVAIFMRPLAQAE